MHRHAVLGFILAFVAGAAVPSGAAAQLPGLSSIKNLSNTPEHSGFPQIAVSGKNVFVVWHDRVLGASSDLEILFRKSNDRGASFEPPKNLSQTPGWDSEFPHIAVSGSSVYVAWQQHVMTDQGGHHVQIYLAVSHDSGSTFSIQNVSRISFPGGVYQAGSLGGWETGLDIVAVADQVFIIWSEDPFVTPGGPQLSKTRLVVSSDGGASFKKWSMSETAFPLSPRLAASGTHVYAAFREPEQIVLCRLEVPVPPVLDCPKTTVSNDLPLPGELALAASGSDVYVAWPAASGVSFLRSSDGGATLAPLVTVSAPASSFFGGSIRMVPTDNHVYLAWALPVVGECGPNPNCLLGHDLWFAASGDRGVSFSGPALLRHDTADPSGPNGGSLGLLSLAASSSDVYVGWQNLRSPFELMLMVSENGGGSFALPEISVNSGGRSGPLKIAPSGRFAFLAWFEWSCLSCRNSEVLFRTALRAEPDLVLVEARPVQASLGFDTLVREKPTTLALVLDSGLADLLPKVKVEAAIDLGEGPPAVISATVSDVFPGLATYYLDPGPLGPFSFLPLSKFSGQVTVDPTGDLPGPQDNNTRTVNAAVKETRRLRVLYKPLGLDGDVQPPPDCTKMTLFEGGSRHFLNATFPIKPEHFPGPDCTPKIIPTTAPLEAPDLDAILWSLDSMALFSSYDMVVGVVREGWFNDNTVDYKDAQGLALLGGARAAIVEQQLTSGTSTAHEIAHALGWVPDGHPAECTDPGITHFKNHTCHLPATGYWVADAREMPADSADFMEPLTTGRWISSATFGFLLDRLKTSPDPRVIGIRGKIFKDGRTLLDPWYQFDGTVDVPLGRSGAITILYLDRAGQTLAQTGFDVSFRRPGHALGELDFAGFGLTIPDVAGTARLLLKRGDQVLAERIVSPSTPRVRVLSPNGGEAFLHGERLTVRWEAADDDGDALTYAVAISYDGGQTWTPLAQDLGATEFTFEVGANARSTAAVIRVLATDGINTAEDRSDAPFTVGTTRRNLSRRDPACLGDACEFPEAPHGMAASGDDVYVVWTSRVPFAGIPPGNRDVFLGASHDRGTTFTSRNLSNNPGLSNTPKVAVSGETVYVVWADLSMGNKWEIFFAASRDRGANFSPAVKLSNTVSGGSSTLSPVVSAVGDHVYVAWTELVDFSDLLSAQPLVVVSRDRGFTFGPPVRLSNLPGSVEDIAARGTNVHVLMSQIPALPNFEVVLAVSRDSGVAFTVSNLSNSAPASTNPRLAVAGDNVYVAWIEDPPALPGQTSILVRASVDGGASFGPAVSVTRTLSVRHGTMKLAASGTGVYVAWEDEDLTKRIFASASRDIGRSFQPPRILSGAGFAIEPDISVSSSHVYFLWRETLPGGNDEILFRKSSDQGVSFSPALNASNTAGLSHRPLAAASGANVYVAWSDNTGLPGEIVDILFTRISEIRSASENQRPAANAGLAQVVTKGALVTLDGAGSSDPDGDRLIYFWTQLAGPSVTLSDPHATAATFTAPALDTRTTLRFQLVVSDGTLDSAPAAVEVAVEVVPPPAPRFMFARPQFDALRLEPRRRWDGNRAPVAKAGPDQTVRPRALVRLDGGASADPDGDRIAFAWMQTGGIPVAVAGADMAVASLTAPSEETVLTFTLIVFDGEAESELDLVQVVARRADVPPIANDQAVITPEDTPVEITLTGSDAEGSALQFEVSVHPSRGTLGAVTVTGSTTAMVTYTPARDSNGPDSFLFVVNDGMNDSVPATIAITVSPVNDGPQANPQSVTTNEDEPVRITLTASDPEGDPLTYSIESPPRRGSISGTPPDVIYRPAANVSGLDDFTFTVTDGAGTSAPAVIAITVNPVNDRPTAIGFSTSTPQDTPIPVTLLGNDPEGAALTYTIVTGPGAGTLGPLVGADITYTPNAGVTGVDYFTFAVSDGALVSIPATVLISVTPIACPLSQGFWETHPHVWPVMALSLGSRTYTQAELLAILRTAVKGDASLNLAHQLTAAKLNLANGSDPTQISPTITHADSLLGGFSGRLPYHVKPSSPSGQAIVNDASVLDGYNNGALTPKCYDR